MGSVLTLSRVETFKMGDLALVTDPGFPRGAWCSGQVRTRPGTWNGTVFRQEGTDLITALMVHHASLGPLPKEDPRWRHLGFEVGVDSGKAGIFCDSSFPRGMSGPGSAQEAFSRRTSDLVHGAEQWGVLPDGIVSKSGHGDGTYYAYGIKDSSGLAVAILLEFILEDL